MKKNICLIISFFFLCVGCTERVSRPKSPIEDLSILGVAGDSIDRYVASVKAPYQETLMTSLEVCLYNIDHSDYIMENLDQTTIDDLQNYLLETMIILLDQEGAEGDCRNNHTYFYRIAHAASELKNKYGERLTGKQKMRLAKISEAYQKHQKVLSYHPEFPSGVPNLPTDKYNTDVAAQAERDIKKIVSSYPHKCSAIAKLPAEVHRRLQEHHYRFIESLILLYNEGTSSDEKIEESILSEIKKYQDFFKEEACGASDLYEKLSKVISKKISPISSTESTEK